MLDGVLLGPHGNEWKKETRQLPEAYEEWIDAQLFSKEASDRWLTFADLIYPLDKTSKKSTLDMMWARIKQVSSRTRAAIRAMLMFRQNYKDVSGKVPDELWNVADIRRIKPSWHGPAKSRPGDDDDTIIRPAAKAKRGSRRQGGAHASTKSSELARGASGRRGGAFRWGSTAVLSPLGSGCGLAGAMWLA